MRRIAFQLDAQALRKRSQVVALIGILRAPHPLEQGAMVKRHAGISRQLGEEQPLGWGEAYLMAVTSHRARAEVDANAAVGHESAGSGGRPDTTQDRAYPREQLVGSEWLGQVVVGTEIQRAHLVRLLAPRTDDDDRGAPGVVHLLENLPAVDKGKTDVEQDDIDGARLTEHLRRGDAVCGQRCRVAGRMQRAGEDLAKGRVVLDDQDVSASLVGQQVPGPIAVASGTTVIVSLKVAGGLKAWWLGDTSSTSTVCRPGARSTGTCQTSTVGA